MPANRVLKAQDITDRILKQVFLIYSPESLGITKLGPHKLPWKYKGTVNIGHIQFEVGSVTFFISHEEGKLFHLTSLGFNNSDSTGPGMPLVDFYCSFDELPKQVHYLIEVTFEENQHNSRTSRERQKYKNNIPNFPKVVRQVEGK